MWRGWAKAHDDSSGIRCVSIPSPPSRAPRSLSWTHSPCLIGGASTASSDEPDVPPFRAGQHLVDSGRVQAADDLEQAGDEGAVFVQQRPVAGLLQRAALDRDLITR